MTRPYADTELATFIATRVLQLKPKPQMDIAKEAGFVSPNVVSMLKSGATKLPLDRVLALAKALECDPRCLFLLAIQQQGYETEQAAIAQIFGKIVTENEAKWIQEIRNASGNTDPNLTALRAIFSK